MQEFIRKSYSEIKIREGAQQIRLRSLLPRKSGLCKSWN